eukprot:UN18888
MLTLLMLNHTIKTNSSFFCTKLIPPPCSSSNANSHNFHPLPHYDAISGVHYQGPLNFNSSEK